MEEEEEDDEEEEEKEEKKGKNKKNAKNKNTKTKEVKTKKNDKVKSRKKNKEEEEEIEESEEEEDEMDDPNNVVSVYLIDSVKTSKGKKKVGVENIEVEEFAEKLDDKVCLSMQERENLFEIIKKNVENFKKLTKKSKSKTIKNLNEKLSQYITSKNNDKCIPIDLENINSIKYFNNFSKNTIIVPNRDSAVFYIENKEDQKGLLFIEFYLTEENKDIIFRLNKYDPKTDEFEMIHDTGKLGKKLKLAR